MASQQHALAKAFGCARMVFNDGLRARQTARDNGDKYISDKELSKRIITQAKKTEARAWLGGVSAVVLQQALADLNTAYRNFFASITGKRKGRGVAPPRFRSRKDHRQAVRFTANARFRVLANGRLRLPMTLTVRAWTCPCGSTHDRDVNAAINVLAAGRAESLNDRGAQVRPTPVPAPRNEAVIHPDAACS